MGVDQDGPRGGATVREVRFCGHCGTKYRPGQKKHACPRGTRKSPVLFVQAYTDGDVVQVTTVTRADTDKRNRPW